MSQIKIAVTSHKQNSHSQQIHLKQPSAIWSWTYFNLHNKGEQKDVTLIFEWRRLWCLWQQQARNISVLYIPVCASILEQIALLTKRFKCNLIHDKISFTFGSFYLIVSYNPVLYNFPDTVSISCNILCILPVQLSLYASKGDLDVFWLGSLFTISRERAFVCMALGRALVVKYWTTDLMHYFCTHTHAHIQKAKVPGAHAGTQNMTIIKYDIHKYFCQ